MKNLIALIGVVFLCPNLVHSSIHYLRDSLKVKSNPSNNIQKYSILEGEQLGFLSNGMIRSSTNVFRFNVGHKRNFHLPFYFNLGANIDIYKSERLPNEIAAFDILNNMGGLLNFGLDGLLPIKIKSKSTSLNIVYQMALKSINAIGKEGSGDDRFLSQLFLLGLLIKSSAWNTDQPRQMGKFWVKNTISLSSNPSESIHNIWGKEINDTFISHTLESGIILQGGLNVKFTFYQFLNNRDYKLINSPTFKLSANVLLN